MNNKMYVGNLAFSATESDLRSLFSVFGEVTETILVVDRDSGRARGFGFVTMGSEDSMKQAIREMDGREVEGRKLNVNQARDRESSPSRPKAPHGSTSRRW